MWLPCVDMYGKRCDVFLIVVQLEGENLVSAGADGSTCLWNVKTGILTKQFPKVLQPVRRFFLLCLEPRVHWGVL